jgi:mannose-6-phosphate isomerase-like protein (cupin superfamily)
MSAQHGIVAPGAGSQQSFMPGERFTWKTTGDANGGALDFAELSLEAGVGAPEHIHHGNDEAYYILEGTYRFKVGEETAEASRGTFVFIPRRTPHAWVNTGTEPGRVAIIFTPGGMAGYFDELGPLVPDMMIGITDISKVAPDVLAKVDDVWKRYGYEMVGPPLS